MSSPRRSRQTLVRRAATSLVAGALPLTLSACGASLDAQTYQERSQPGAANVAVGTLAIRDVAVLPPEDGRTYEPGDDAVVTLTVVNADDETDTLIAAETKAAESVEILAEGRPGELEVPALGSTTNAGELLLQDLTSGLYEGTYITLTLTFANNGTITFPVPVATSGFTDRPIFTGEEGEEEEPALQAPAGGHHGGEEPGGEGGEPGEGIEEPTAEGEVEDGEGVPENEGEDGDPDGIDAD